jgi:hypothetical protein
VDSIALAFLTAVGAVVVGSLFLLLWTVKKKLDRLSRLEGKLDALLREAGVSYDPLGDVAPGVRDALERDDRILAIKKLREATGLGLKEAKAHVDELRLRREFLSYMAAHTNAGPDRGDE